jgi:hypothetical protein
LTDELHCFSNSKISLVQVTPELLIGFSQFLVLLVGGAKLLNFSFQVVHSGEFFLHLSHSFHFLFKNAHLLGPVKDFEFQIEIQLVHFRNILRTHEHVHINLRL